MFQKVLIPLQCLALGLATVLTARAADPSEATAPMAAGESARQTVVPPGFKVSLFAAEPDIVQPIAMAVDLRGRLWVVECLSYPDWTSKNGDHDRVVILEDSNHDGRFDKKTVFLDNGRNLTGIALGFGGVFLCSTPELIFVPDRNGDDVPDGPPEVALDGWTRDAKHNVFNGLTWGPDGWLYGCHGILADSRPGPHGASMAERPQLNCGVWRYHPVKKKVEVVAHGTTNPWGVGFDDLGRMYIVNCVIKHLFHVIPGAHYDRMFGQDLNPYAFGLIPSSADHIHWAGGYWHTEGVGLPKNDNFGGGHAHCGTMIYLGDNWPAEYRNGFYSLNVHGRRMNHDLIGAAGSGIVAKHAPDPVRFVDPWFRGTALLYGPDGGVFVADWSDAGECHDYEDIHRENGRIYKVTYGEPKNPATNLGARTDAELIQLQSHPNDWFVTTARVLLQQRAAEAQLGAQAKPALQAMLRQEKDPARQLRDLWALHAVGGLDESMVLEQLANPAEHVRAWTVQLAMENRKPSPKVMARLVEMSKADPSPVVRLHLASALQRLAPPDRMRLASGLAAHAEDAGDQNLPLMIWYGVKPLVSTDDSAATNLLRQAAIPLVRQHIARRLGVRMAPGPVLRTLLEVADAALTRDAVAGLLDALNGRRGLAMPPEWSAVSTRLEQHPDATTRQQATLLGLIFSDPATETRLRREVVDPSLPVAQKRSDLDALVQARVGNLVPLLHSLLADTGLRGAAVRGLAAFDHPETPARILAAYPSFAPEEKADAVNTLTSRAGFALKLLQAVRDGVVPRRDVSPFAARQMAALPGAEVASLQKEVLGEIRNVGADKAVKIAQYKKLLGSGALREANPSRGRALFVGTCAPCHTLFGEGGSLAPELTGSQRSNLDYILENIVDPNAVVWAQYRVTFFETRDDRLISGVVKAENESTVTIQTQTGFVTLPRNEIVSRQPSALSMMPEGLLDALSEKEVADLVAYLQGTAQVALPTQ